MSEDQEQYGKEILPEPPEPKHITFTKQLMYDKRITGVWVVRSKYDPQPILGIVKWFGRWRKYSFFPEDFTVFEEVCLQDIINFIVYQTKLQRSKKK